MAYPGRTADLSDFLRRIKRAFTEYSTCQAPLPHFETTSGLSLHKEEAANLTDDWNHLHTDAAWTEERSCLAGTRCLPNMPISHSWLSNFETCSPLQAEAKAVLLAITLALEHSWCKIWIRSDALFLVDAIIYPHHSLWAIKSIVSDIISLLALFWD
ncbi:hypothetical protein CRG98_005102 [Punica granatum]|uniref:RNase H type-1 domain-containing protein n=1 Tax=Punica granatum TaxID=22663 RepID=A0A2I0L197_PUNGR|nr:hypothetical protein CRG98_005102 [Punica granatum]